MRVRDLRRMLKGEGGGQKIEGVVAVETVRVSHTLVKP